MDRQRIKALLEKYWNKTILPGEQAELDQWYDSFDQKTDDARFIAEHRKKREIIKKRIYKEITRKTGFAARYQVLKWAGIAALILTSSITLFNWQKTNILEHIAEVTSQSVDVPKGQVLVQELPDGSKVHLNAGSHLTYNKYFMGHKRDVYLEGEGFFEVAKNPRKPFVVHTGDIQTTVLGTSFNVKSLPALRIFQVTVRTGHVKVQDSTRILADLHPFQQLSVNCGDLSLSEVSDDSFVSWTQGKFYIQNQSFKEIAWRLRQRYGHGIIIKDTLLKEMRFSGDLTGLSTRQALSVIREIHPFKIRENNNHDFVITSLTERSE